MLSTRWRLLVIGTQVTITALVAGVPTRAPACDVCAIYIATENHPARSGVRLGLGEQFTHFSRLKEDGKTVDNPGERLNSSITQLVAGYDFSSKVGVQITVPIIDRRYRRREEGLIRSGRESGLGDVSVLALVRPFHHVTEETVIRVSLLGGLKLPTGDTGRLREELEEGADDGLGPLGVHGHDLALGSGSLDVITGAAVFASWKRWFWTTALQYAIRSEGDFGYRYANELTWNAGPGWYALLRHGYTLAVQALVSGEYKGLDDLEGEKAEDTGSTTVYIGPSVSFTHGASLVADLALDVPMRQDNTSVQLVPDYRIRGGLSWRF